MESNKWKMASLFCIPLNSMENIDNMVGQQFNLGGVISGAHHLISKKGNNYGRFTLDDYSGQYEFLIFGDEYEEFKHFLVPFLSIRIKVDIGTFWNNDDPKVNFREFEFLREVSDEIKRHLWYKKKVDGNKEKTS